MGGSSVLSEMGTIQIEYATLTRHTKNRAYLEKALGVYTALKNVLPSDYLIPCFLVPSQGTLKSSPITLGGLGDSFYEYLLKYWLITNQTAEDIGDWYFRTADSIIDNLGLHRGDMWYLFEKHPGGHVLHKMDHLACFAGGMFALGAQYITDQAVKKKHMEVAEGIGRFCWEMYNHTETGLPGEHVNVDETDEKFILKIPHNARSWIMRPEAVETWFILWRFTKKQQYREWGWQAFQAMNKYARQEHGYSGIRDVHQVPPQSDDVQQSFFLAETLKYLYLLFGPDDVIPLDEFVFNTEAHPLLIFGNW